VLSPEALLLFCGNVEAELQELSFQSRALERKIQDKTIFFLFGGR
jgi:hypothetical protein